MTDSHILGKLIGLFVCIELHGGLLINSCIVNICIFLFQMFWWILLKINDINLVPEVWGFWMIDGNFFVMRIYLTSLSIWLHLAAFCLICFCVSLVIVKINALREMLNYTNPITKSSYFTCFCVVCLQSDIVYCNVCWVGSSLCKFVMFCHCSLSWKS